MVGSPSKRLGLIAGQGQFPLDVAEAARERGIEIVAVGLHGHSDPSIEERVHHFRWLYLGEIGALIEIFREFDIDEVMMAGKVPKSNLYGNPTELKLDALALAGLAAAQDRKDDSILLTFVNILEAQGFHVLSQAELVPELFAAEGQLGSVEPSPEQIQDAIFGFPIAKAIGSLDIGQTVVVGHRAVLAVEAIEGTDEAIRRGGALGNGCACVVKVAKPSQDPRFDVPAVGPDTVATLIESEVSALVVEAGTTLIFEREETLRRADEAGIAVLGVTPAFLEAQLDGEGA